MKIINLKKAAVFLALFLLFVCPSYAEDDIYSDAYFEDLIQESNKLEVKNIEVDLEDEPESLEEEPKAPEEIAMSNDNYTPFQLKIEKKYNILKDGESFRKEDTKTIIPVTGKFSFIQDTIKTRNKQYNSDDCRLLAGAEYQPFKFLNLASGLETNYRGFDQNPNSRKLYFNPSLKLGERISLGFYNKLNIHNQSQDHDIGVNISPFKSKALDFGMYAGLTKAKDGTTSESINFSTSFSF